MNLIHRIVSRVRIGKAQGSLEYIMMLSAVSIIVVIAIALMMQLKGVALHPFAGGAGNLTSVLSNEIANLSGMVK
jgi:hypothetical protein